MVPRKPRLKPIEGHDFFIGDRPPGSAGINVEQQFNVFSEGTPPLFRQAPYLVE
jgi:hypothetical protein